MISDGATEDYPPGFEDDDRLRSRFIIDLLRSRGREAPRGRADADTHSHVPRTLHQFWHDPTDIPEDVRDCMRTWDPLRNDGVAYRLFDDESAAAYIAERYGGREVAAFSRCQHPAGRSDYLRMCVILDEGGLYVDADDVLLGDGWAGVFKDVRLKVQPLCFDVSAGAMAAMLDLAQAGFPAGERVYYLNNNPIAAPPGHPVLRRALDRATTRLLGSSPNPDIQATTGPGNFTAAFAAHARRSWDGEVCAAGDLDLLVDWELTSAPRWDLAYRYDNRNWRNVYGC